MAFDVVFVLQFIILLLQTGIDNATAVMFDFI